MRPLARAAARRAGALGDQLTLEFGQRREDAEDQTPVCGGRVDLGPGAREHSKTHTAVAQLIDGAHQVLQITAQPVELPHDQCVARLQRLQAGLEARAMVLATRGAVFVDALVGDAGVDQRVTLQVEKLAPIRL